MSKYNFVHLHNHSEYSLLDGMMTAKSMVAKAKELGMNSVALTDHGNLYGAIEFFQTCKEYEIKPIIGCEFYMAPLSRFEKSGPRYHLTIIAKSEKGYKNLLKLSSKSFIEGFYYKPRIDFELLEKYSEGLICLSGCLQGYIPNLILESKINEAVKTAHKFIEIFGKDSFFLEVQIHGIKEEKIVAKTLYSMSKNLKIPLVATNDAHYINKNDSEAHDVLLCIGTKSRLNDPGRMKFQGENFYFKTEKEMELIFKDIPESLSNTQLISEMCDLNINLPGPQLPEFLVPEDYSKENYLKEISMQGLKKRYEKLTPELTGRLNHELEVINRMGFAGYFLIVWDFIQFAKENNIWVGPGRGSGAGSIAAYALGITNIDPIKYGLIFERFLNEQRVSMPDFDIDFCKERRQEVIDYVTNKYSKEKVCQIVTFSKMKAKAVIRDVGRVLEIPLKRVDEIAKMIQIGDNLQNEIQEDFNLREIFNNGDSEEKKLLNISIKLEGLSRHTSMHAAGVVIGQKPITEYVPLQIVRDVKNGDLITTQYPGPQLEACGLVKMDFLGLITLTLMRNCLKLLEKRNIKIDLEKISFEDSKVYNLFARGETEAIFQFESPGMKKFLKKLKPTCLDDLIAMNALYRPGPMNFIDSYILRKHGKEKIEYDHPFMESILKETNGIMIYQEQVMKIAQILAGYDLGNADILRRAMGKKKLKDMKKHEKIFIEGCSKNNINKNLAAKIFNKMSEFANYGFNKSHAAAYAYLAYQCAYLKTYYPAEFMASVLTSEIGKPDKILEYINIIREMNIKILPPDVNYSEIVFTVEDGKIRYALNGIKGVGETASYSIIKAREKEKKFIDFYHFLQSIDLRVTNRAVLETLIQSGCMDSFGQKRKWMYEHLDESISEAQNIQADNKIGQGGLFDIIEENDKDNKIKSGVNVEEWNEKELLFMEKNTLGFYISGHPLKPFLNFLKINCSQTSKSINKLEFDTSNFYSSSISVTVAGIIESIKIFTNEQGNNWAIVTVEDLFGKFSLNVYKKEFSQYMNLLVPKKMLFIKGNCTTNKRGEKIVIARTIEDLELKKEIKQSEFHIYLNEKETNSNSLNLLKSEFNKFKGELSIFFHIIDKNNETIIKANNVKAPKDQTLCTNFIKKYNFIKNIKIL